MDRSAALAEHLEKNAEAWDGILGRDSGSAALAVFGRLEAVARIWAALQREALAPFGLNYAELATIGMLRTSLPDLRRSPTELRSLVGQTSAGMTRILDKLEDEGLVRRVAHAEDGRRVDIVLTARGARLAERSYRALLSEENELLDLLSKTRRDEITRALDALLEAFAAREE